MSNQEEIGHGNYARFERNGGAGLRLLMSPFTSPTLLVQTSSRPWMDTYSGRLLSKAASTAENHPFITPFV